jgi:methyltransferase
VLSWRGRSLLATALGLERLGELAWSRRNLRRSRPGSRAARRSYPLMVAVNAALFVASARPRRRPPPRCLEAAALAGLGAATGLRLWVITSLGGDWNVRGVVPEGMRVVRGGPYRWLRHPNYLAVIMEFACLPLAVGAYIEALLLSAANVAVLVPRIRAEEEILDRVPGYGEAFAGVPRFVPKPSFRARRG